jgi:hypothetical protein
MTSPKDKLLELAERCEAATGPDRELSAKIALAVHDWLHEVEGNKPLNCRVRNKLGSPVYIGGETGRTMDYTASLDAAMTLAPEGWTDVRQHQHRMTDGSVRCYAELEVEEGDALMPYEGKAKTPALALCAAALRSRTLHMTTDDKPQDTGASVSPTGLSQVEPVSRLGSSRFDPSCGCASCAYWDASHSSDYYRPTYCDLKLPRRGYAGTMVRRGRSDGHHRQLAR